MKRGKKFFCWSWASRLSILDLTVAGRQPFSDIDKRYYLVFNGEIYNYIDIANELRSYGFQFKSKTDTEVVLNSYVKWGKNCFSKFNGMWSIAIYDDYKKELILSRDRFGKKPLYYHLNENFIIFSSEPKAIFHHPKVSKKVNIRKCSRYAGGHYRHIDNDNETFFDNLYQIRPGTYSIFNKQKKIITSKFWSLQKNSELSKKFHIEDIKTIYKSFK